MPATLDPLDQYLGHAGDFEPDADYVDGEIELRPMGVLDHSSWQYAIQLWFHQHRELWNVYVRCELRVQTGVTTYRVPDVVVWDRSLPSEQILTRPPMAVFEVLSPEDRMSRMMKKLADYERMGIKTIRVIVPETGKISSFVNGKLNPVTAEVEHLPNSRCFIDWAQVRLLLDC